MSYNYPLPDGSVITVPDGTPASVADQWARRDFPELFGAPKPKQSGGIANLIGGARDLAANYGLAKNVAFGDEASARTQDRTARAKNENIETTSWDDVKNVKGVLPTIGKFGAFARDAIAQTAAPSAATMAGAATGAKLGAMVPVPGSTLIGAGVGGFLANYPQMFGANLSRQDQANPDQPFDTGKAATAATGQSALDVASTLVALGPVVSKLAGKTIASWATKSPDAVNAAIVKAAETSLLKATGKGAALGVAAEMPTELAQTVLERWQANLPLTGVEANKEYEATLAAAGTIGAAFGGPGGAYGRYAAKQDVAAKDRVFAEQATAEARDRAEADAKVAKATEEERKKSPEYLLELDANYNAAKKKVDDLRVEISAIGKSPPGSAEEAQKKELGSQIKIATVEARAVAKEWNANRLAVEKAKKSPEDFMLESALAAPTVGAGSPTSIKEIREKIKAQQAEQAALPTPEAEATQKQLSDIMEGLQYSARITGEEPKAADILSRLTPELVNAAQKYGVSIPGIDKASSNLLIKTAAKDHAKAAKEELTATMQQRQADLVAQATPATEPTDPTQAWKESLEQDAEQRNKPITLWDQLTSWGLDEEGKPTPGYLDGLFNKAFNEGNETGPATVKLPEGVRPVQNATSILNSIDSLYSEKDAADKATELALRSGNKEAAMSAAAQRERASTTLLSLTDTTPVAGGIISTRKVQESALADAAMLIDDLKRGTTLDSKRNVSDSKLIQLRQEVERIEEETSDSNPNDPVEVQVLQGKLFRAREAVRQRRSELPANKERSAASSTTQTLTNQIDRARQAYIGAVIQEAAITRAAFGKSLTEQEALTSAVEIRRVFDEWITRAAALPRSMAEEERIVEPAQMRGTELVRSAKTEKFDPRPLAERRLGAYREATEVLQEQIKRIGAQLASVSDTGRRVEPDLKTQFATSEQAKVAEQRGETAQTRGGELRRRREYVENQVDKALQRVVIPPVKRALEAAKAAVNTGQGSTDVVSGIPNQRFEAGLLDSAEELASRVLNGQKERTRTDTLVREINEALQNREVPEGQGDLFDPAPLVKQQTAAKQRIDALTAQVAELKTGKKTSLKEGVTAAKRITDLEKAISLLQGDKKARIDTDVREARKEYARLQEDLGHIRATAANFDKSTEVKAGRKAAAVLAGIRKELDRIDAETAATRKNINVRLGGIKAPLTDVEEAEVSLQRQASRVRAMYTEIVADAFANARKAALTQELQTRIENAQEAINAARAWIGTLKEDRAKNQEETRSKTDRAPLGQVFVHNQALAAERDRVNKKTRAEIDAADARMSAAQEEIKAIKEQVADNFNSSDAVAVAAADKSLKFQQRILQDYIDLFTSRGFTVDVEKSTVTNAAGVAQAVPEAEIRRQKEELKRAENAQRDYAAEAVALRPLQQGLGLPGRRRVAGKTEEIKSISEVDEERRLAMEVEREQRAEEAASRKDRLAAEREVLQPRVDELIKQLDEKRAEAKAAPNARARKPIETQIKKLMNELSAAKLAVDTVGETRKRKQQPTMREQSAAPATLRAGTPESNAATRERDDQAAGRRKTTKKEQKEETALQRAIDKQDAREANTDFDVDTDTAGFGESPDVLFSTAKKDAVQVPPSFAAKHMVTTLAYHEADGKLAPAELDAKSALAALDEDIGELRAFLACLKG